MAILLLPTGSTVRDPKPGLIAAKPFGERIAVFWRLLPDEHGQIQFWWTVKPRQKPTLEEAEFINRHLTTGSSVDQSGPVVEHVRESKEELAVQVHSPWRSYSFLLVAFAVFIAGLLATIWITALVRGSALFTVIGLVLSLLFVVVIGAFWLRGAGQLSERGFLQLMGDVIRSAARLGSGRQEDWNRNVR
jgi:hypothetical protein